MEDIKKFESFLDRMQGLLDEAKKQGHIIVRVEDLENAFPELKESDGERIRKSIIDIIKSQKEQQCHIDNTIYDEMLAWLEKQGEKPQGKSALEAIKEEKVDNATKVEPKDYSNIDPHFFKPAGKVKPMFENGQWVVWKGKCYKVNDNGYEFELVDQDGVSTLLDYVTIYKNALLWDITKDAKDGDVLCCESGWTCIFKALDNHTNTFSSYCFMDSYKWFCNTGSECHTLDKAFIKAYNREIYPATKEQRDTLLKAMHEAGYEWNAEKKEVRKIEFPAEWSEKNEMVLDALIRRLEGEDIYVSPHLAAECLKSIKERCTWKPSDEQMDAVKDAIDYLGCNTKKVREYLMSLYEQLKKLREK